VFVSHIDPDTRCHSPRRVLGNLRELSSFHVQSFDFRRLLARLVDLDGRILLLVEKQDPLKDGIEVNLQELVPFVDELLKLVGDLECLRIGCHIRVDKDGIGISVNDLFDEPKYHSIYSYNLHRETGTRRVHEYV
jgi:hypothetical protein